jgi:Rieske Fe-S protein
MPDPDDRPAKRGSSQSCEKDTVSHLLSRRTVLKFALGTGLGLQFAGLTAGATDTVRKARPQAGDFFTFSLGDRQGQLVTAQDLPLGGPPLIVYPLDPSTQTIRDGSRLNRVLVVRFAQEELTEQTRAVAAEGIVGYSAVCTHTGCDVSGWRAEKQCFVCPCHTSTFDPKDRARVVSGPAPRSLAMLPLRVLEGKVTAAGSFSGRVGAEQK